MSSSSSSDSEKDEGKRAKLFMIVSKMNGKVVDIQKCKKREGTPVIMFEAKTSKRANQLWYLDSSGCIRAALNDMVFQGEPEGEPLKTAKYSSDVKGHWKIIGDKIFNGLGQCLDIKQASSQNWAPVCAYKLHGGTNQCWDIKYISK